MTKSEPADHLTYADTTLNSVTIAGEAVVVHARGYDNRELRIAFSGSQVTANSVEDRTEVAEGKILRLDDGRRRMTLVDEDNVVLLEIEFQSSTLL
jgi:hypothetical protein